MPTYTHLGTIANGTLSSILSEAEQPGTTLQHEKRGLVSVSSTFQFKTGDLPAILAGLLTATHPRHEWAGYESSGRIEEIEAGLCRMTAVFQGSFSEFEFTGNGEASIQPPPVFETQVVTSEEPLATNPYYDVLTTLEKSATIILARDIEPGSYPAEYVDWVPQQQHLFDKLISGVTAWDSPRDLYTVRYTTITPIPGALWELRGKIVVPWGNYPQLAEDRNWRLTGITHTQSGLAYDITLSYTASGPGGWEPKLYTFPVPIT